MSALDVAQRYFDGWNQHDAGFLVATFDPDGTYRDDARPQRGFVHVPVRARRSRPAAHVVKN